MSGKRVYVNETENVVHQESPNTIPLPLTHYHDVKVKACLHGLLPHLLNDGVNTNVPQQSGPPTGAMGAAVTMASTVHCGISPTMTYAVTDTMTSYVGQAVTPNGNRNPTWRSGDSAPSDAQSLRRERAGGGRSPHIRGLGRNSWLGSHFWGNDVRHVYTGDRKKKNVFTVFIQENILRKK